MIVGVGGSKFGLIVGENPSRGVLGGQRTTVTNAIIDEGDGGKPVIDEADGGIITDEGAT